MESLKRECEDIFFEARRWFQNWHGDEEKEKLFEYGLGDELENRKDDFKTEIYNNIRNITAENPTQEREYYISLIKARLSKKSWFDVEYDVNFNNWDQRKKCLYYAAGILNDIQDELCNYLNFLLKPRTKYEVDESIKININPQKVINLLAEEEWKAGKKFINPILKDHFTNLLTNSNVVLNQKEWKETSWMLYKLIESFIDRELLSINKDDIPEYMIKHFTFKAKANRKSILDSNNKAANNSKCNNIFTVFTANLTAVYGKLTVNI